MGGGGATTGGSCEGGKFLKLGMTYLGEGGQLLPWHEEPFEL